MHKNPSGNHRVQYHSCHCQLRVISRGEQPQQFLTFQHFHSHGEWLVGLLLVDANSLSHDHLTKAALPQRFTQSKPETKPKTVLELGFHPSTNCWWVFSVSVLKWDYISSTYNSQYYRTKTAYNVCKFWNISFASSCHSYRVRGNSHLGSEGSSSSETLASIGPSLDDRRAIRTSGVLEFMEELESKDTCLGAKTICYSLWNNWGDGCLNKVTERNEKPYVTFEY